MAKHGVNEKTYRLSWGVTCAFSFDVRAKNRKEAKEKAKAVIEQTHESDVQVGTDTEAVLDEVFLDPKICVERVY